jgi:hypothetical protein
MHHSLLTLIIHFLDTKPEARAARKTHKFSPIFTSPNKLAKLPPLYMRFVAMAMACLVSYSF